MIDAVRLIAKRLFPNFASGYRLYRSFVRSEESYLKQSGWLRSMEGGNPVDLDGNPVPWMNYPIVELLKARIPADAVVFEYGSGGSTVFWASRVREIISLEYDRDWFNRISGSLPANAKLRYCAQDIDGIYSRSAASTGSTFDVIFVDGRDRVNCVIQSRYALAETGVLVLDDSQRSRYRPAFDFMRGEGFSALSIGGLKPTGIGLDETTIFYRSGNCLGL